MQSCMAGLTCVKTPLGAANSAWAQDPVGSPAPRGVTSSPWHGWVPGVFAIVRRHLLIKTLAFRSGPVSPGGWGELRVPCPSQEGNGGLADPSPGAQHWSGCSRCTAPGWVCLPRF